MSPPRAILSWSSGKDSAFALHEVRRQGLAEVIGVLTTIDEASDRVAMHGTRKALLNAQLAALGLPMVEVPLPWPCPNETYEALMGEALACIAAEGVRHVIFGDLFLREIRAYREARMDEAGMTAIFPLWGRNTATLAKDMIASGLEAHLVTVDAHALDRTFAGRRFDVDLLNDLPPDVDPCGENGEFHTAVTAGPMFTGPISVRRGETVMRDGFIYADLELA